MDALLDPFMATALSSTCMTVLVFGLSRSLAGELFSTLTFITMYQPQPALPHGSTSVVEFCGLFSQQLCC